MTLIVMNTNLKSTHNLDESQRRSGLTYCGDSNGNIAIMTAVFLPVLVIGMLAVTDLAQQANGSKLVSETAIRACNRVVGSSLTKYPSVEERNLSASYVVNAAFDDVTNITNVEYNLTAGFNTAEIEITADRVSFLDGSTLSKISGTSLSEKADCAGIPPYPRIDEIVYSANFGEGVNGENPYIRDHGRWGVIDAEKVGWQYAELLDGTETDGCGVEMQNWEASQRFLSSNVQDYDHTLPPDATNPYVVELDGYCNTALEKTFELHPGKYEFSIWYRGRSQTSEGDNYDTNQIGMYLQSVNSLTFEPDTKLAEQDKIITMNDRLGVWWEEYSYEIFVEEYDMYRITLMGEGSSNGNGGLFTTFTLTYKGLDNELVSVSNWAN